MAHRDNELESQHGLSTGKNDPRLGEHLFGLGVQIHLWVPPHGFTGSHLRLTPSEAHPEPQSDCQAGRSGGEPEGMGNTLQAYDYVNIAAERQRQ
jgi:hypothetical protein